MPYGPKKVKSSLKRKRVRQVLQMKISTKKWDKKASMPKKHLPGRPGQYPTGTGARTVGRGHYPAGSGVRICDRDDGPAGDGVIIFCRGGGPAGGGVRIFCWAGGPAWGGVKTLAGANPGPRRTLLILKSRIYLKSRSPNLFTS